MCTAIHSYTAHNIDPNNIIYFVYIYLTCVWSENASLYVYIMCYILYYVYIVRARERDFLP